MGNSQSMKKINYEDMQTVVKNPEIYLIINTLPITEQKCLIINTTLACDEEVIINKFMNTLGGNSIILLKNDKIVKVIANSTNLIVSVWSRVF